jgi:hypothetical protein
VQGQANASVELREDDFNSNLHAIMEGITCTGPDADSEGGAVMVMGNSIWSKGVEILPPYSSSMQATYKVLRVCPCVVVCWVLCCIL